MARVYMDNGALWRLQFDAGEFLDTKIGPLIAEDAKRYAPRRTGFLAESIGWEVDGLTLYIFASAPYAAYVELGHRVFHPRTGRIGPEVVVPQPFLRPAVYKYRTPEMPDPPATFPVAIKKPWTRYRSVGSQSRRGIRWPLEAAREHLRFWRRRGTGN